MDFGYIPFMPQYQVEMWPHAVKPLGIGEDQGNCLLKAQHPFRSVLKQ